MKSKNNAVYGLIAKSRSGTNRFASGLQSVLPSTFPDATGDWFCVGDIGLAIYAPTIADAAALVPGSALSLVGHLYESSSSKTGGGIARKTSSEWDVDLLGRFRQHGAGLFSSLSGEFSAVYWDAQRNQLILARDHLGQREIFVREDENFFVFCSELEPLLADTFFQYRLDFESAVHYLSFGVPAPGRTLAREIIRIPAGHFAYMEPGRAIMHQRYYTPIMHDVQKVPDRSGREHIEAVIDKAIENRIVPGRQAILLSGGVDSSYIATTAAQLSGGESFDAYTIHFDAPYDKNNETEYAGLVAEKSGIRHHPISFSMSQALASLDNVLVAIEPCSAWATMTHSHLLSHIHGDGHTHLLSGLGADEIFGGYWKYFQYYARLRRFEEKWPISRQVESIDALMWQPELARTKLFPGIPRFMTDRALRAGLHSPYSQWSHAAHVVAFYRECRQLKSNAHLFEMMVAHECQHRIPGLLFANFETISRTLQVRSAYPFLDHGVVGLGCGLGASERFWMHEGKWRNKKLLREIAGKKVPEEIMKRPLQSYTAPVLLWMEDPRFSSVMFGWLREAALWKTGLVKHEWLQRVIDEVTAQIGKPLSPRSSYVEQMWILATLAAWYERWIERKS